MDFGSGSNSRTFTLEARVSSPTYSFYGGVEVIAGTNATFNGSFYKPLYQSFEVKRPTSGNVSGYTTYLNFYNDKNYIYYSFRAYTGRNNITFTGNQSYIDDHLLADGNTTVNNVVFRGSGAHMGTGNSDEIEAKAGGTNNVTFEGADSYTYAIRSEGNGSKNNIEFKSTGASIKYEIEASNGGRNNITFAKKDAVIEGQIIADGSGSRNLITLQEGSTSTSISSDVKNGGENHFNFKSNATIDNINTIGGGKVFVNLDSNGSISGRLTADAKSTNTITLAKPDPFTSADYSLTIKEMLAQNGGGNIIVADNINLTLDVKKGMIATDSSYNQLTLKGDANFISKNEKLNFNNLVFDNTAPRISINLASDHEGAQASKFRLLTIGEGTSAKGLQGSDAIWRVFVNTAAKNATLGEKYADNGAETYGQAYSDRVIIHKGEAGTHYINAIMGNDVNSSKLVYQGGGTNIAGNIAVATVKSDTGIVFKGANQTVGYDAMTITLKDTTTDMYGKTDGSSKDYTTYFIDTMSSSGISKPSQQSTTAALGASYDLYLANINSLNKRMGELRENTGAQGVWARVFHGMQTSKFDITTQALYTTIQAGYDHAFGSKGANNYLGFALSYANAMSRIQGDNQNFIDANNNVRALERLGANAVELAFYNAYVQDGASKATGWKNGFYSDSILKLSVIMSNFSISNEKSNTTANFALSFSQELGYRFLLGEERAFYIDPQVEMTLGYLSASSMQQTLGQFFLNSTQDAIFTLRSRAGSSFGYKFDKFTQNKGFNSSLYLGTYFAGDFISGGNVQLHSNFSNASLSPLELSLIHI